MSNQALTKTAEEKAIEFVPFGAADKIKLTVKIVQNIVAVPTRSGKTCTEKDAMKFIMLCQAQRLNPFAGDAFLVGYDSQNGASFSLITAHQAFLKRAETCKDYEGMESGVVVLVNEETGETKDREGDFHLKGESIVGGWAKVFRAGRRPTYRRIRMERFNKGFAQWKEDAAGMIVKCAESDALRSTFPTLLGGLYSEGEGSIIDIKSERVATTDASRLVEIRTSASEAPAEQVQESERDEEAPAEQRKQAEMTPQAELEAVVTSAGHDFTVFQRWGTETGNIKDAGSLADFSEIKTVDAQRFLRARTGLIKSLNDAGGAK